MTDPTCVSLFSGIGGLDHGLARAGFRHLLLCEGGGDPNGTKAEREQWKSGEWRRSVLRARFPGVPVFADVRELGRGDGVGGGLLRLLSEPRREVRLPAEDDVRAGAADVRLADGRRRRHVVEGWESSVDSRHAGTDEGAWHDQDARGLDSPVDLICGGFPCQDLSVAGKRAGLAGERSGLFFEFARIAESLRPRWLLVENVPGLLSSNGGRDFGVVLGTLAEIGYGLAWRVLDSRFFGVPQRRRRVFIVGALAVGDPRAAAERAGRVLAVGARCPRHPATRGEAREDLAGTLDGGAGERGWAQDTERMTFVPQYAHSLMSHGGNDKHDPTLQTYVAAPLSHGSNPNSNMAGRRREDDENLFHQTQDPITEENATPTLGRTSIGMGVTIGALREHVRAGSNTDHTIVQEASVRRLTPTECERLQALPDGWTDPHGDAPDSRRYAGLGDAVTATVGEWIGRRIIANG